MNNISFETWLANTQQNIESSLAQFLPAPVGKLQEAMCYSALAGGKRIRPVLTMAAGELVSARQEHLLRAGCAVEFIHTYSLIHDDLPCMDNDTLRRGKPTCHVQFGEATALLAGDALQTLAFELLSEPVTSLLGQQLKMVHILANSSGYEGMAGGQAMDLAFTGQDISLTDLEIMHVKKTGALINAAIQLGALCGQPLPAEAQQKLDRFAQTIGLAFQIVDDILDYESDTATLGKTAGKDQAENKSSYPNRMGLEAAKERAWALYDEAMLSLNIFGPKASRLREIANWIVSRSF